MNGLIKKLSAPLLSLSLLMIGSGMLNTFVTIRLQMEGSSIQTIGAVASTLYLGILVGSLYLGRWISKAGHIKTYTIFAAVFTFLVLIQMLWIHPVYWSILRFICGFCTAGVYIVIESWCLLKAENNERSSSLCLYHLVLYLALCAGQFVFNLIDGSSIVPFFLAALFFALSALPLWLQRENGPKMEYAPIRLKELIHLSPFGIIGGLIAGMILGSIHSLVPIYGKEMGLEIAEIGTLMGIIIFGGLLFQWPLGLWADKTSRLTVLNTASFMTVLLALGITQTQGISLFFLGWFLGGFSFTIYPLSMSYFCEKVPENQIVAATGGFVLAYAIGAMIGPLFASITMSYFGYSALFYYLAAISSILCLLGVKR